jgi:stage IV sporulation protein FB
LLRPDLLSALKDHERETAITEVMRAPIESLRAATPLESVLDRLFTEGAAAICVVDADGVLIGLLTRQNISEMMMIKAMRPDWHFERRRGAAAAASAGLASRR